jgi:hypothetical protein
MQAGHLGIRAKPTAEPTQPANPPTRPLDAEWRGLGAQHCWSSMVSSSPRAEPTR